MRALRGWLKMLLDDSRCFKRLCITPGARVN